MNWWKLRLAPPPPNDLAEIFTTNKKENPALKGRPNQAEPYSHNRAECRMPYAQNEYLFDYSDERKTPAEMFYI